MIFEKELELKILPFINSFQKDFKIHGNSHISRCLIYASSLCYLEKIHEEDRINILYSVAFHDSGRVLDYGIDKNENLNIEKLKIYLEKEDKLYLFENISKIMLRNSEKAILNNIFYDVDVLDIMRPSCGIGGIFNFKKEYSKLIKERNYFTELINECWSLICLTDNNEIYNSVNSFDLIKELIKKNDFKILCT